MNSMRWRTVSLFSLALVVSSVALAASETPFAGRWVGTGVAEMGSGKKRICGEIGLQFSQAPHELMLENGFYRCEDLQAAFDPSAFEIRSGNLFYKGAQAGRITNDQVAIFFADPIENYTYALTLTRAENALQYLEEWTESGKAAMTVTGVLFKRD